MKLICFKNKDNEIIGWATGDGAAYSQADCENMYYDMNEEETKEVKDFKKKPILENGKIKLVK